MSKLKQRILFSIMFCAILIVAVVGIKLFSTNIKATPSAEDNLGIVQVEGSNYINFEYIPGVEGKATTTKVFRYGFADPDGSGRKVVTLKSGPTNTSNVTIKYASTGQVSNGADVADSIVLQLGNDYCPGVGLANTDYPTQYIYIIVSVNDTTQPASVLGNVEWRYGYGASVIVWVYNSTDWVHNYMVLSSVNSADEIPRYNENITSASVTDNGMIEYGFIGWGVATEVYTDSLSMGGIMYNAWEEYLTYPFSGFDAWPHVIAIYGVKDYYDGSGIWTNFFNNLYTTSGDSVYYTRSLTDYEAPRNLILPERPGWIVSSAFSDNSCIEVLHLGGVYRLYSGAFKNCNTLRAVVWGSSTTLQIAETAFLMSGIEAIDLSSATGSAEIHDRAFYGCTSLTTVVLPPYLSRIKDSTFNNCNSLRDITIPGTVTFIGMYAFQDSGLYDAHFEDPIAWFVTGYGSTGTFISETSLANSSTAADYLSGVTNNYEQCNWYSIHQKIGTENWIRSQPLVTEPEPQGSDKTGCFILTSTSIGSYPTSYASQNAGETNSCAFCNIIFYAAAGQSLSITIMSDGENNYDYALVSNLDTALMNNSTADTSGVSLSLKGRQGEVVTHNVSISTTGYHFITVKYRKDGSVDEGEDCARFNCSVI